MSKYFIVEGFENLIFLLENVRKWDYEKKYNVCPYISDIDKLQELLNYDSEELASNNYETDNFKIKVIEKFFNKNTSIFMYECETK